MRYREFNNQIHPAIPYIALYDVSGSQAINGSFLTWDSIKSKTSHFLYSANDNRIQLALNSSGLFEVTFETSVCGYGNLAACYFDVYKNGSIVSGGRAYCSPSCTEQNPRPECVSITICIFLQKDDYIQIKGQDMEGLPTTVANTSRIIIKFLPMRGFNNSSGGRLDYKGDVMR